MTGGASGSALWAAYGDALGFITELVSPADVRRRTGGEARTTVPWLKRVGGKFGLDIELPVGCYSDDTQLRLSTSRAIRGDGRFDVEAFSRVELPVWLCYALGAGRGTRDAATGLTRPSATWDTNFHKSYVSGGGNGAAMRIQPHVWAARDEASDGWLPAVLRNALTTHGHARGILGAAFHAGVLAMTLRSGRIPSPDVIQTLAHRLGRDVPAALHDDRQLREFWIVRWEESTKQSLGVAFIQTANEVIDLLAAFACLNDDDPLLTYHRYLDSIDARDRATLGSGTKTAVAAYILAWLFRDRAGDGIIAAANAIGTDTDTIATMAGAVLGSVTSERPRGEILDEKYIVEEAMRCEAIAQGARGIASFPYPDLLTWRPPESANAVIGILHGTIQIAGLGEAAASGPTYMKDKPEGSWRWLRSSFGQSFLAKTRKTLLEVDPAVLPVLPHRSRGTEVAPKEGVMHPATRHNQAPSVPFDVPLPFVRNNSQDESAPRVDSTAASRRDVAIGPVRSPGRRPSLHELTRIVIDHQFPPSLLGDVLLDIIDNGDDGIADAIGFAAIIAKARLSRLGRRNPS